MMLKYDFVLVRVSTKDILRLANYNVNSVTKINLSYSLHFIHRCVIFKSCMSGNRSKIEIRSLCYMMVRLTQMADLTWAMHSIR